MRNTRWAVVSESGGHEPAWQLFVLTVDYDQQHGAATRHPEVVRELGAACDR